MKPIQKKLMFLAQKEHIGKLSVDSLDRSCRLNYSDLYSQIYRDVPSSVFLNHEDVRAVIYKQYISFHVSS